MTKPTNMDEKKVRTLKAQAFDLLTKRGLLEQQVAQINQAIQAKVQEIKKLEANTNDSKDKEPKKR